MIETCLFYIDILIYIYIKCKVSFGVVDNHFHSVVMMQIMTCNPASLTDLTYVHIPEAIHPHPTLIARPGLCDYKPLNCLS